MQRHVFEAPVALFRVLLGVSEHIWILAILDSSLPCFGVQKAPQKPLPLKHRGRTVAPRSLNTPPAAIPHQLTSPALGCAATRGPHQCLSAGAAGPGSTPHPSHLEDWGCRRGQWRLASLHVLQLCTCCLLRWNNWILDGSGLWGVVFVSC